VRRSETVSPIFTLMTLVESEPLPHPTQDGWKTPRAGTGPPRSMWLARCSCGARVYAWAVHPRHVEFLRFWVERVGFEPSVRLLVQRFFRDRSIAARVFLRSQSLPRGARSTANQDGCEPL